MIYKKELKEDELENVDGGYIFYNRNGNQKWQVINDSTGKVERDGLARREYAKDYAKNTDSQQMRSHGAILTSLEKISKYRKQNRNVSKRATDKK